MRYSRYIVAIPIGIGVAALAGTVILAGASSPPAWAQAKLEHQAQVVQERNAATRAPKPATPQPPIDTAPAASRPAGILDMRQAPFLSSFFLVQNQYHAPVQGNPSAWWDVYAGGAADSVGSSPNIAALAIAQSLPNGTDSGYKLSIYKLAGAGAWLRIVAVSSNLVTLVDAGGSRHTFSLVQLTFLS